jgi:hypothetical protein
VVRSCPLSLLSCPPPPPPSLLFYPSPLPPSSTYSAMWLWMCSLPLLCVGCSHCLKAAIASRAAALYKDNMRACQHSRTKASNTS